MKGKIRTGLAMGLGLVCVLLVVLALGFALYGEPEAAQADGGVSYWFLTTIADGTTAYAGTTQNLGAVYAADYGSVSIQVTSDVSATASVLTITPHFSNDPGRCSAATNWFTATDSYIYNAVTNQIVSSQVNTQTTTVVTNTSTITQEVGYVITSTSTTASPTYGSVALTWTITGDGSAAREVPIFGQCMRIHVAISGSDTYTPTIYARLMDRQ